MQEVPGTNLACTNIPIAIRDVEHATDQCADELDSCTFLDDDTDQTNQPSDASPSITGTGGNKFIYPEFSGFTGYDYLESIVTQIIPRALKDTWVAAVKYQAPNSTCYVSSERILRERKIKAQDARTLRKHWQAMREMGLATFQAVTKIITDKHGSHAACVVDKDFSGLYHLAHEFHEWTLSSYQHFPPRRDIAPQLLRNKELALKLVRFDCYRKALLTDAPGPKYASSLMEDDPELPRLRQELIDAIAANEHMNPQKDANRNIYPNTLPTTLPQDRIQEDFLPEDITTKKNTNVVASSSEPKENRGATPCQAIGTTEKHSNQATTTETEKPESTHEIEIRNHEKREVLIELPAPAPEIPEKNKNIENDGKRAVPDMYRERLESLKPDDQSVSPASWTDLVEEMFPLIRLWLNDEATELRVINNSKHFFRKRCIFDPRIIHRAAIIAFEKAYSVPDHDVRKRHSDSLRSANWMPLFVEQLNYAIQPATRIVEEEEQRTEALERQTAAQGQVNEALREPSGAPTTGLEAQEKQEATTMAQKVQDFLQQAEHYQIGVSDEQHALIVQGDPDAITDLVTRLREAVVQNETDHRWHTQQQDACRQVTRACAHITAAGAPLHHTRLKIFTHPCPQGCGSHLGYVADNNQTYCLLCVPSYQWPQPLQCHIQTIVRSLPSYDMLWTQIEDEYFGDPAHDAAGQ